MAKERKDKHFIKKPTYPGGLKAMRAFIGQNLTYPQAALDAKIEGTVSIRYTIDYKGKVIGAKVISSLGYGCDEEAERLVKLLIFQVEKNRNIRVQFHRNIQIHFRLPKEKPATTNYQYHYKSTSAPSEKPSTSEDKPKSQNSYNIQIKW
ncbi:MAG: energy transducer TonB [Bacteroidota bacterium]